MTKKQWTFTDSYHWLHDYLMTKEGFKQGRLSFKPLQESYGLALEWSIFLSRQALRVARGLEKLN